MVIDYWLNSLKHPIRIGLPFPALPFRYMPTPQPLRNVFPPPRSRRKCVTELAPQVAVDQVFLATRKQLRPNRHGQLYLQVELADRSGTITGRMWNASDDQFEAFAEGDYVRVVGTTQLYSGALQIILTSVEQVDPTSVDETSFRVLTQDAVAGLREIDQLARLHSMLARSPLAIL